MGAAEVRPAGVVAGAAAALIRAGDALRLGWWFVRLFWEGACWVPIHFSLPRPCVLCVLACR